MDVETSRVLYELTQKYHDLTNISFKRALREGGLTILIIEHDRASPPIKRKSELVREIGRRLKTRIIMIKENMGDIRELAREIFSPAQIRGVNVLFKKEGEEYHIKITREDLMLLPASIDVLQTLLAKVTDKKIKLVFE